MRRSLRSLFRNLTRRTVVDRSLDDEVRACVDIITANNIGAGMSPEEARRRALVEMGGVEVVKERVRDVWRGALMDAVFRDFRHAGRVLRKQPLLSGAIVVTLAVGLGAPASTYGVLNQYLFGLPTSRDPDAFFRLIRTGEHDSDEPAATSAQYVAFRDRARSARALAAWSDHGLARPLGLEDPTRVDALPASCNSLHVLGVERALAGRLLTEADCDAGAAVAVMSERLWRRRFDADPAVIGRTTTYGGASIAIIGVAPIPAIQRQADDPNEIFDLWFPYTATDVLAVDDFVSYFAVDDSPWLEVAGLLAPGVTRAAAAADFNAVAAGAPVARHRDGTIEQQAPLGVTDGTRWSRAPADALQFLGVLLLMPAIVLLMACVNAAALLLSRSVSRQREMAVRLMLGTNRAALIRMLLIEALLLAGAGAMLSLLFVITLPPVIARFFQVEVELGVAEGVSPDWRVFLFLGGCAALAAVVSGLTPALASLSPRPLDALRDRPGRLLRPSHSRTRRFLIAVQVAASMAAVIAAASFSRAAAAYGEPGFSTAGLIAATIAPAQESPRPMLDLEAALTGLPGVAGLAVADRLPVVTREPAARIRIPHLSTEEYAVTADVSPGYFDVFGFRTLAGRTFTARDVAAPELDKPAVVSEPFVRRHFGEASPLGSIIEVPRRVRNDEGEVVDEVQRLTVVGVVAGRLMGFASTNAAPTDGSMIYRPIPASTSAGVIVVTASDEAAIVAERLSTRVRELVGSASPVGTVEASLLEATAGYRRVRTALLVIGGVAFLLAGVGVVGIVSFDARQRRREFAIRSALGATAWAVRRRVVSAGFRAIAIGLVVGLFATWALLTFADSEGLLPIRGGAADPAPYATVAATLALTALATLFAVAWPAGNRDPLQALREE